jgi:NAD(P)-dependent dehydrogenase (short-subunit alcohol dehydrogenase family)
MKADFEGSVFIIAGTTGIGGETARHLARRGASIFAVGKSASNAERLRADLVGISGEHAVAAHDLCADGAAESVVALALKEFGRIDGLFHVAGISGRKFGDGPLGECLDEGWDTVMNTNLRALFRMNRAVVRHWLATSQPGVVLNMASVLGFSYVAPLFDTVAYASAKAAIISLTQHSAARYAASGLRFNVIAPALVDTPMAARAVSNLEIREFLKRKQPLRQAPLTDTDCAEAAAFLLGRASAAITGIVLPVDAGWCVSG